MKSQKEGRKKNSLYYAGGRQVREDEGIKEVPKEKRKKKKKIENALPFFLLSYLFPLQLHFP